MGRHRKRTGNATTVATLLATALSGMTVAGPRAYETLPGNGNVTAGDATIIHTGNSTTINQNSVRAAIDWDTFNIGQGASVDFVQPSSQSIILNRVVGQDPTRIFGAMRANGHIFILNPNGVLFAPGAQVHAAGILASTRDIRSEDFMAGRYILSGSGAAVVENHGDLRALEGGYVALVGAQVINHGTIHAPTGDIRLAAADQVTLRIKGAGLTSFTVDQGTVDGLVDNRGLIKADGGRIYLTAEAVDDLAKAVVNNDGVIEARTVDQRHGSIILLGDILTGLTSVGGTLDTSAPEGGGGGFIETSAARVQVKAAARVVTAAAAGKTGTWLIDPANFSVAVSGGDIDGATLSGALAGSDGFCRISGAVIGSV